MNQEKQSKYTPSTAWPAGVSGNPNGRPKKGFSLTDGMRSFLSCKDPREKKARKDLLVEQTYKQAMRGDIAAIKMIFNYLEGMPKQSMDMALTFPKPILDIDVLQHDGDKENPQIEEKN